MNEQTNLYIDWRMGATMAQTKEAALKAIEEEYNNNREWGRKWRNLKGVTFVSFLEENQENGRL